MTSYAPRWWEQQGSPFNHRDMTPQGGELWSIPVVEDAKHVGHIHIRDTKDGKRFEVAINNAGANEGNATPRLWKSPQAADWYALAEFVENAPPPWLDKPDSIHF
jgi:hypothetical protein